MKQKVEDRREKLDQPLDEHKPIQSVKDLIVYRRSYDLAMLIFKISQKFPREETYSLTDQVRRASRSVPVNIREGFAKRKYRNVFIRHLLDAYGSCEETSTWIDMARDCAYMDEMVHSRVSGELTEISAMLYSLIRNWRDF